MVPVRGFANDAACVRASEREGGGVFFSSQINVTIVCPCCSSNRSTKTRLAEWHSSAQAACAAVPWD